MTPEVSALVRSWHRLQQTPASCVAACHAIVDARSGGLGIEVDAHPALSGHILDPEDPSSVTLLEAYVKRRRAVVVTVLGRVWAAVGPFAEASSRHGALGDGLHAVVLLASDGRFLVGLDPYFASDLQPFSCPREVFVAAWTGQVEWC